MTKKSLKSKSSITKPRNSSNGVSFNRYSFDLGNLKILTNYLNEQTKDIIIKLYRSKKFDSQLYQQRTKYYGQNKVDKYVVLTEIQAIQIIKEINLQQRRQLLTAKSLYLEKYLLKTSYASNHSSKFNQKRITSNLKRTEDLKLNMLLQNQMKERQPFQRNEEDKKQMIRRVLGKNCLKIEKQIFDMTIFMIIEYFPENLTMSQLNGQQVRSIVIFQQSYLPKQFEKNHLIQLIGVEVYQQKLLVALKTYHYTITYDKFYNPTYRVCHDCNKIISDMNYPQDNFICSKTMDESTGKLIKSDFAFTPYTFLQKIIKKNHFSHTSHSFTHPYIQYHSAAKNSGQLACNRTWCGYCMIDYKREMDLNHCQFCDRICRCIRCRKFQKLVQFLAHYLHFGGEIENIESRFLFTYVFETQRFNCHPRKNTSFSSNERYSFPFKPQLQKMYELYVKTQHIDETKQWNRLSYSQILSGTQVEAKFELQMFDPLYHPDKWKKIGRNNNRLILQKKDYRKQIQIRRQRNIEAKISKLDEQIKTKIIESQFQQFAVLKKKLQKSKILRSANPLNNLRIVNKNSDVVIISQSAFRKMQRKFHETVQIKEVNPLKKLQQQNQYFQSRRWQQLKTVPGQNQQKRNSEADSKYQKSSILSNDTSKLYDSNIVETDQFQNNYGSMWQ